MSASPEMIEAVRRTVLPRGVWQEREAAHRARVGGRVEDWLERSARGEKHPVWDFLFTYYNFAPRKLLSWVPAIWEQEWLDDPNGTPYEWPPLKPKTPEFARWVATLCGNIEGKPARFQCHGWHEWAMVYRQSADEVRHSGQQLRLPASDLAALLESRTIVCSHYDAYRFFTPEARPLNVLRPDFAQRIEMEQGGCLHVNMDLYKWAYKLWPWLGSDLVADAFEVAVAGRDLDMRASPYDLRRLGFEPILMETEAGRAQYEAEQQQLAERAAPVRQRLREGCEKLLELTK